MVNRLTEWVGFSPPLRTLKKGITGCELLYISVLIEEEGDERGSEHQKLSLGRAFIPIPKTIDDVRRVFPEY